MHPEDVSAIETMLGRPKPGVVGVPLLRDSTRVKRGNIGLLDRLGPEERSSASESSAEGASPSGIEELI